MLPAAVLLSLFLGAACLAIQMLFQRSSKDGSPKIAANEPSLIMKIVNSLDRVTTRLLGLRLFYRPNSYYLALVDKVPESNLLLPNHKQKMKAGLELYLTCEHRRVNHTAYDRLLEHAPIITQIQNYTDLVEFWNRHPDIADVKLKPAVIIIGLNRTGTTYLYRMLSNDPSARSTRFFELIKPVPPATRETIDKDPRIQPTDRMFQLLRILQPARYDQYDQIHLIKAEEPEEDIVAHLYCHRGFIWYLRSGAQYRKWFMGNASEEYLFSKRFYQMLQSTYTPDSHWIMKAPAHQLALPELMEQFPDSKLVFIHRKVEQVLPSICQLADYDPGQSNCFEPTQLGRDVLEYVSTSIGRMVRFREAHPELADQIIDIQYTDLVADPISTVKKIYQKCGLEYTTDFEAALIQDNKNRKQIAKSKTTARLEYSLEQYGLSREMLNEAFGEYEAKYLKQ
ncbi:hypothetical protein HDU85_003384 [Gaertneriomyces sp. JEL0708]|nr:hypothetical protein HDU85_003384 [Gaertneriomyces sp. JEL0708]